MTNSSSHPSGTILVGVDGSPASEHAVMWAADEARLQRRGLTLAHAQRRIPATELAWLSSAGIPPREVDDQIRVETEHVIERARSLAAPRCPETVVETVVRTEDPRSLLLEWGASAAMTVVGTRGHGHVVGLLLGSVSGTLVRHSETPVAVVRPRTEHGRGVLVASDGSAESLEVIEHAYREATLHQVGLTVVHCLWDGLVSAAPWTAVSETDPAGEEGRLRIAESVAGMAEKFPDVEMSVEVTRGAIGACLVDLSARHELLVIGRPPRPLLQRLTVSSLTTPVAEHAHSPVLVVP
jgi:nucleotide-binding universal stress UspA family protein